jgi:3D (Asp-Asp-Asp) domain-containing protein
MALPITHTEMAAWPQAHVWRDLRLAAQKQSVVDQSAHGIDVQASYPGKCAFGMLSSLRSAFLLLVAICLPMIARSVHVKEGPAFVSDSLNERSGDPSVEARTARDPRWPLPKMVASCRLRSLLADPNVPADFVSTLQDALVSENFAHSSSRSVSARLPSPTQPVKLANSYADSLDRFFRSSTSSEGRTATDSRLARLTTYWPEEGDSNTKRRLSSTGVRLRDGHCAVDPKVIPYGSVVTIPGVGKFVAVDTGPAVVSRRAARESGRNSKERVALVVDIYCSSRSKAHAVEASSAEFAVITWSF